MKPDDEGVHPFANTDKAGRKADVVFVLVNLRIGERSLVFATHSMGGLIAKKIVCGLPEGQCDSHIRNVRRIVFYGTPHRGAEFASAAETLGRYLGVFRVQKYIKEMTGGASCGDERGWSVF